jgi:hypothetical protein
MLTIKEVVKVYCCIKSKKCFQSNHGTGKTWKPLFLNGKILLYFV